MMQLLQPEVITPVPGQTYTRSLSTAPGFSYYFRMSRLPDRSRTLIVVHGISRRAAFMIRALSPLADHYNFNLIAPNFAHRAYPDYQRLGRQGRGARADHALIDMWYDACHLLDLSGEPHLMGFSGGAQFSHRFVCAYPGFVKSVTIAAAGWYTSPRPDRTFPHGTKATKKLHGLKFDFDALVRTPSLVLVGGLDRQRDMTVRQNNTLDAQQGVNRLERAQWFHEQLVARSPDPIRSHHQIRVLPNTGHDFGQSVTRGGLDRHLIEFCDLHSTPIPLRRFA